MKQKSVKTLFVNENWTQRKLVTSGSYNKVNSFAFYVARWTPPDIKTEQ